MKFSVIFCVFLFFSGFAFGQKVTMEIQILDIAEYPSYLEEIIIYDSSIDSIVFYNKNYKKLSLLVDLDTTHLYVFYGQTANVKHYSLRDSLKLTNLDTIRTYEIYTVYDVCTVGFSSFYSNGNKELTEENLQEISGFNEGMKRYTDGLLH